MSRTTSSRLCAPPKTRPKRTTLPGLCETTPRSALKLPAALAATGCCSRCRCRAASCCRPSDRPDTSSGSAEAPNRRRSVASRPLRRRRDRRRARCCAPTRRPLVARKPPTRSPRRRRRAEVVVAEKPTLLTCRPVRSSGAKSARQPGAPGACGDPALEARPGHAVGVRGQAVTLGACVDQRQRRRRRRHRSRARSHGTLLDRTGRHRAV